MKPDSFATIILRLGWESGSYGEILSDLAVTSEVVG